MAAALRFAVLICLLCSCAVQPALAPSLSQDRPTERAAREGCATTRDGRGCAAAEAAAHQLSCSNFAFEQPSAMFDRTPLQSHEPVAWGPSVCLLQRRW